jgi:hypothetical protein
MSQGRSQGDIKKRNLSAKKENRRKKLSAKKK